LTDCECIDCEWHKDEDGLLYLKCKDCEALYYDVGRKVKSKASVFTGGVKNCPRCSAIMVVESSDDCFHHDGQPDKWLVCSECGHERDIEGDGSETEAMN